MSYSYIKSLLSAAWTNILSEKQLKYTCLSHIQVIILSLIGQITFHKLKNSVTEMRLILNLHMSLTPTKILVYCLNSIDAYVQPIYCSLSNQLISVIYSCLLRVVTVYATFPLYYLVLDNVPCS